MLNTCKRQNFSPFREGYIFTNYAKFRENKTLAKIFEFTVLGGDSPKTTSSKEHFDRMSV